MRGVVSGGMVSALEFLGLRNTFDVVYGSSSGAMAGAYFISRQARFGTTIYYQCINNSRFIRKLNFLSAKPVMNTAFLLDNVCKNIRPLRTCDMLSSDIPLKIIVSSLNTRTAKIISDFNNSTELFDALRCSINVPAVAGPPITFRGDRLLDGALYEGIPINSARIEGASHALVLLTRPVGCTKEPFGPVHSLALRVLLRNLPSEIVHDYLRAYERYRDCLDNIASAQEGRLPNFHASSIRLDSSCHAVSQLETSHHTLRRAAMSGFDAVLRTFKVQDFVSTEVLGCSLPEQDPRVSDFSTELG